MHKERVQSSNTNIDQFDDHDTTSSDRVMSQTDIHETSGDQTDAETSDKDDDHIYVAPIGLAMDVVQVNY